MCTNTKWITNKYTGRSVLVNCGHCAACQQEKANRRTARIHHESMLTGYVPLFCTLTYTNGNIPYIYKSDLVDFASLDESDFDTFSPNYVPRYLRVYRDNVCRRTRVSSNYDMKYIKKYHPHCVDEILFDRNMFDALNRTSYNQLHTLVNGHCDRVSVCLYSDVQDFIKRLKENLYRRYGKERDSFRYFVCTELGPKSGRAHVHGLFYVPSKEVETYRRAINEAWPFNGRSTQGRKIEIARNAASYVSSYVNRGSDFPPFFEAVFKPTHHYSRTFGVVNSEFDLPVLLKKIQQGNITYTITSFKQGTPVKLELPVPEYVINRYFPRFKGYYLLNDAKVFELLSRPTVPNIFRFARALSLSSDDVRSVATRLQNACRRFKEGLVSLYGDNSSVMPYYDYAYWYIKCRNAQHSTRFRRFYDNVDCLPVTEQFDNINMLGRIRNDTLSEVLYGVETDKINPNFMQFRVSKTHSLTQLFEEKNKSRKLTNYIMVENGCEV